MRFDGVVGDMVEGRGSEVVYEMTWRGNDLEKLKEFVERKLEGRDVVSRIEEKVEGGWRVGGMVRSGRGII